MGIMPNNPCTIGPLTTDYIGTYLDKILALADRKDALDVLYTNLETLTLLYDRVDDLVLAADTVTEALPMVDAIKDEVIAAKTAIITIQDTVITLQQSAATSESNASMYRTSAEDAADAAAISLTQIESVIGEVNINAVSLELGERFQGTASLSYGARI